MVYIIFNMSKITMFIMPIVLLIVSTWSIFVAMKMWVMGTGDYFKLSVFVTDVKLLFILPMF